MRICEKRSGRLRLRTVTGTNPRPTATGPGGSIIPSSFLRLVGATSAEALDRQQERSVISCVRLWKSVCFSVAGNVELRDVLPVHVNFNVRGGDTSAYRHAQRQIKCVIGARDT